MNIFTSPAAPRTAHHTAAGGAARPAPRRASHPRRLRGMAALVAALLVGGPVLAADTTPAEQLKRWTVEAGAPASAERGKVFFNSRHGGEWSCASCHNTPPTTEGKHPNTGKVIPTLAPSFNAKTFTDVAKADKWFRRNCNDVLKRECTAPEKADVMAYLINLK